MKANETKRYQSRALAQLTGGIEALMAPDRNMIVRMVVIPIVNRSPALSGLIQNTIQLIRTIRISGTKTCNRQQPRRRWKVQETVMVVKLTKERTKWRWPCLNKEISSFSDNYKQTLHLNWLLVLRSSETLLPFFCAIFSLLEC